MMATSTCDINATCEVVTVSLGYLPIQKLVINSFLLYNDIVKTIEYNYFDDIIPHVIQVCKARQTKPLIDVPLAV